MISTVTLRKKICLLGEFSVGKTSLVRRFVEDRFDDRYLSTIGAKISRVAVALEADTPPAIELLLWDLAGSEQFNALMRTYYSGAGGAILVCDLTRPETAEALPTYAQRFWSINPEAPLLVLGNKADLREPGMLSEAELTMISRRIGVPTLLTSARTGANVQAAFHLLAQQLLASHT